MGMCSTKMKMTRIVLKGTPWRRERSRGEVRELQVLRIRILSNPVVFPDPDPEPNKEVFKMFVSVFEMFVSVFEIFFFSF